MGLVVMRNKQAVTTSLAVAQAFDKNHKDVLEAIRTKLNTAENSALLNMFMEDSYTATNGKQNKMYYMNRDGFTFIAMGFTGRKADNFKLKYIQAFNAMEEQIKNQQLPQTPEEKLALTMQVANRLNNRMAKVEDDIDFIKNKSEIDSTQRYKLKAARNRKAVEVCGGHESNFYKTKNAARKVFRELEHDLKDVFVISRYEDLKKEDFERAITFINNWHASYPLEQEIARINAQINLEV